MNQEKCDDYLAQEYLSLQKAVEAFDERMIAIKTWSVTASGAALATAYLKGQPIILLIGAIGATVFWFIDAFWKVNQRVHYPRIRQIEAHFAGTMRTLPFQVSKSRLDVNVKRPKVRRALWLMLEPISALPHAAVAIAGVSLYFLEPPKLESEVQPAKAPAQKNEPAKVLRSLGLPASQKRDAIVEPRIRPGPK